MAGAVVGGPPQVRAHAIGDAVADVEAHQRLARLRDPAGRRSAMYAMERPDDLGETFNLRARSSAG